MDLEVFSAASTGNSSFFENLSESGCNIRQHVTIGKNTVLHVALQFKQFEAARSIVNLFPSLVYEVNSRGNTPLHIAARIGKRSMVKLLMDRILTQDIEAGGRQMLLSMRNLDGDNALHVAVRHGHLQVVKILINGRDPGELASQKNNAGESALFLAVDRQDYPMASYILDKAPDCSYDGRHGMNVLHALVIHTSTYSNKEISIVRDFEESKRKHDKEIKDPKVFITIFWVVNMLFLLPLQELLADPSVKQDYTEDKDVMRLRTSATIPGELVKNVMEKGPSIIDQYDGSGWTPLLIAAHLGNADFVALLLEIDKCSAYRQRNEEGLSAFHIAAKEGNYDVMAKLMDACPCIYELLDSRGRNALHTAAESGCWTAICFFGDKNVFGDLVNEQDNEGNTPSHLAAINGDTVMAERLGSSGEIVLNATNKDGFTTMDNVLLKSKLRSQEVKLLWDKRARVSLRGVLSMVGIKNWDRRKNLDCRKKKELAGDGNGNGNGVGDGDCDCNGKSSGDGNGSDEGMSNSDFLKQVREGNMLVATLIATVTFTAAFTVPGGFNQDGNVDEGLAVLSKITAFRVFLVSNTLAFGLSATSVFVHFLASTTSEEIAFHRRIERRTAFYTNWSIGAMLVAFIAGSFTVVPHSLGITVAVLLSCCFLSSLFLPLTIKDYIKYM